ncbi:uncharacterized protein LOC125147562 [Prionailurus viverrinus]|uniref:uncharacterized protein LOC125147562 n=1 Tax=Prionailurus viverrinus TaxID=61388 RepID=UPI001FF3112D|nr:uncharacterized protein LOC125147562 [Prionailurus viverrinus]
MGGGREGDGGAGRRAQPPGRLGARMVRQGGGHHGGALGLRRACGRLGLAAAWARPAGPAPPRPAPPGPAHRAGPPRPLAARPDPGSRAAPAADARGLGCAAPTWPGRRSRQWVHEVFQKSQAKGVYWRFARDELCTETFWEAGPLHPYPFALCRKGTFRIKQFLAKKQKQKGPIPQGIWVKSGNEIGCNSRRKPWMEKNQAGSVRDHITQEMAHIFMPQEGHMLVPYQL